MPDKKEKLLIHLDEIWQKDSVVADLEAQGLHPRVARHPREYASIISGIGGESYKIYVPAEDYAKARQAIAHLLLSEAGETDERNEKARNEFKRIIVFSVLGLLVLPIVFNWLATQSFLRLRKDSSVSSHRVLVAGGILALGWAVALWLAFLIAENGLHLL